MKLRGYGEDRLVSELTRALPLGADVRVGAGDDCAVIGKPRDKRWQLLKADAVVEDVHFLASDEPRRVGGKALCRALSDIAAMGGIPQHALVTVAVSPDVEVATLRALYAGLRDAARRFGVSIVGGETSRSPGPLFINITLTGWVERKHCALRSGGKAGDAIYVTGRLGGSRAGKHLDFTPRLAEARWLVSHAPIHAMMDLSDGLAADLPRLAAASRCGFRLEESAIPRSPSATIEQALIDGEDFELLFTLSARAAKKLDRGWRRKFPQLELTRIGTLSVHQSSIVPTVPRTSRKASNLNRQLPQSGFDHFAQP
jgi:thiamine-monophosphate kinase